ncbi:hypothetical protein L0F63_007159, partial [Massospora cicadina]
VFIMSDDPEDADAFARGLGDSTVITEQRSADPLALNKSYTEIEDGRSLINAYELRKLLESEVVLDRTKKRKDLEGNDIRPHPIKACKKEIKEGEGAKEKTRYEDYTNMLGAWEYLFPEAGGYFDDHGKGLDEFDFKMKTAGEKAFKTHVEIPLKPKSEIDDDKRASETDSKKSREESHEEPSNETSAADEELMENAKILIEIVTNAGILEATALTDTKGKRNWELITKIVSGFSATVMVVFLQVLFSDGYAVTSTLPGGVFVQAVAGLALAFAVIEGPNAFQSLFGVHAGLNDGLKDLMTLSQGSMLAKNVSSGVMKAAGAVKNGFGGAAGGMAGMMAGAIGNDNPTDNLGKTSEDLASDTVAGGNESNQEMNQNNQNQNSNQNNESLNEQDQSNNGENVDLNESSLGESNADNQDFSAGTEAMNATDPELASLYGQMDDGGGAFEGEPAPEQMGDQGSNFDQTPPEESTQMGSDHSQATDNDLGHDNLNKASQSQNMAQNEAEQFAGESIARPMTLSDA